MAVTRSGLCLWLLVGCIAGCSPSERMQPHNYQPDVAVDDPGPWPIVLNRHLYSYWVSAGPYRTNWVAMTPTIPNPEEHSIESDVTIQAVSHSEEALELKLEVTDTNGGTVLLRAFAEPKMHYVKLGKLDIPWQKIFGGWRGNICSFNHEIARFGFDSEENDAETEDFNSRLVFENQVITTRSTPPPEQTFLEQMASNGFLSFDYMDGDRRVGFIQWLPDKRLWIDAELPETVRLAIAADAAFTVTQFEAFDRQQAATNTTIYIPAN